MARRRTVIGLVGPLPPPSGGMANQTRQLARLLAESGLSVELVQVNAPYRPAWVGRLWGVRAAFRLVPYLARLWGCAGRADLFHVMANSGWAWHLFAAPAIWIAHLRGVPAIVNYRGGEAESFLRREARWVRPSLARARAVVVPSRFLERVFAASGIATEIVPNIIDLDRFSPGARQPGRAHVVVTRNLEPIYDIATALRAFATIRGRYPHASLSIAGSGPLRSELERLAGALHDRRGSPLHRKARQRAVARSLPLRRSDAQPVDRRQHADLAPGSDGERRADRQHQRRRRALPGRGRRDRAARAAAKPGGNGDRGAARPRGACRWRRDLRTAGIETAKRYAWTQVREELFAAYARALGVQSLEHCAP